MKRVFSRQNEQRGITRKDIKSFIDFKYERSNKNVNRKGNCQDSRSRVQVRKQSLEDIVYNLKQSKTLSENVLNLEPLAYYFDIKPEKFWNSRYKEIYLYCEMQIIKQKDNLKENINLYDALTDKMIQADAFLNKKPKVVSLRKMFKELFNK